MLAKVASVKSEIASRPKCKKVSTKAGRADSLVRLAERGDRVREVRVALGMSGDEFAATLTQLSKSLGAPVRYDEAKVSKIERGTRRLTAEEAAIVASIDPEERPVAWLVFGDVSRKMDSRGWTKIAG